MPFNFSDLVTGNLFFRRGSICPCHLYPIRALILSEFGPSLCMVGLDIQLYDLDFNLTGKICVLKVTSMPLPHAQEISLVDLLSYRLQPYSETILWS